MNVPISEIEEPTNRDLKIYKEKIKKSGSKIKKNY